VEVSASVSFGYFSLGVDESVEVLVTGKPSSVGNYAGIQVNGKWIYLADQSQRIFGYKSFASVGGEQAYRDVQAVYYLGDPKEKNATIRDYTGSQTVNLRDCVALANAIGRYEYFTAFGILYSDPTGLSQDITVSLEGSEHLFVQQEFFQPAKMSEQDLRTLRIQESVLQAVYSSRPDKFDVLMARGNVPAGFSPVA
jgi:hypothetical protein